MNSAIVLAGGRSTRFGRDKGLWAIGDQTLVERVHGRIRNVAQEVVIAVGSEKQRQTYSQIISDCVFAVDESPGMGPLGGLWSGLRRVTGKKVAVVGCDMPFISAELMSLLYDLSEGYDAVIPRWPIGYIEPLHSVYDVDGCLMATRKALRSGRREIRAMISGLATVLYVSTEVIRKSEPDLRMFTNINSRRDLLHARRIMNASSAKKSAVTRQAAPDAHNTQGFPSTSRVT